MALKPTTKNLIIRPSGLGDVLLSAITIASIRKKYPTNVFDVVVLEDYYDVAKLFLDVGKIYTVPLFYYSGQRSEELFKRHQREFEDCYDNILNWQDEKIEIFKNKNTVPRVDLFLSSSPFSGVEVKISDVRMKQILDIGFRRDGKKHIGVCMSGVSLFRSFDERIIIDTIKKLLEKDYVVHHFGFRKISGETIKNDDFIDHGCTPTPMGLFQIINDLDFLITVDTAAFHMATLCNTPYLAFFGEVNAKLRTSHLNLGINGRIVCNDTLDCVRGECLFCHSRPCLNDYEADWIVEQMEENL